MDQGKLLKNLRESGPVAEDASLHDPPQDHGKRWGRQERNEQERLEGEKGGVTRGSLMP